MPHIGVIAIIKQVKVKQLDDDYVLQFVFSLTNFMHVGADVKVTLNDNVWYLF